MTLGLATRAGRPLLALALLVGVGVGCKPPGRPPSQGPQVSFRTAAPATWQLEAAPDGTVRWGNDLELRTTIYRGEQAVALPGAWTESSAELARGSGWIRERVLRAGGSLEQRWDLTRAPGPGPLRVVVELPGAQVHPAGTGVEIHRGTSAFRYSEATFVDAAGRRTPVKPAIRHGAIELVVPGDVLRRSKEEQPAFS